MKKLNIAAKIKKVDKTKPVKPVSLITYQAFSNPDFEFDTEEEAQEFTKAALPIIEFAKDHKKFNDSFKDGVIMETYNTQIMLGEEVIADIEIEYYIESCYISFDEKKLVFDVHFDEINSKSKNKNIFSIEGIKFHIDVSNRDDVYDIANDEKIKNKVFVKQRQEAQKLFNRYKKLDFKNNSGWDLFDLYCRIKNGELKI